MNSYLFSHSPFVRKFKIEFKEIVVYQMVSKFEKHNLHLNINFCIVLGFNDIHFGVKHSSSDN